jgi:hypothetical protein
VNVLACAAIILGLRETPFRDSGRAKPELLPAAVRPQRYVVIALDLRAPETDAGCDAIAGASGGVPPRLRAAVPRHRLGGVVAGGSGEGQHVAFTWR